MEEIVNYLKKIKAKLKFLKLQLEGNKLKRWYGSEYGGFFVREELLNNQEQIVVYSCGVGKDISFDMKIMKKYNQSKVFAFDPTPVSIKWINNQQLPDNFLFFPVGLSDKNGMEKMFFPKTYSVSYGTFDWDKENNDEIMVEMTTIDRIAEEHGHTYIDILKMDIEGSEFAVLNGLDLNKIQFGQILVEFHERFLENGNILLEQTLAHLKSNGYECFAISDDFEYSFVNKNTIHNK